MPETKIGLPNALVVVTNTLATPTGQVSNSN
jgi:hypothetical protein